MLVPYFFIKSPTMWNALLDFSSVHIVVDLAKCHAYSFTAEARSKARSRTSRINARSLKPQKKRRGAYPNRWNSCSPASDRQDRVQTIPTTASINCTARLIRDPEEIERLSRLTMAPPRCPIRQESMDGEEPQNMDVGVLVPCQTRVGPMQGCLSNEFESPGQPSRGSESGKRKQFVNNQTAF
jgi:hypothetical protein